MRASDAYDRTSVRAYVPVNDGHGGIVNRTRQDRTFPRTRPHDDCVYLIWEEDPAPNIRVALESLCSKVTRVGHSSSAVQMWVVPEGREPEPDWLPGAQLPDVRLRVPSAGTLRSLESAFNGAAIQEYDALAEAVATARGRDKTGLKSIVEKVREIAPLLNGNTGRPNEGAQRRMDNLRMQEQEIVEFARLGELTGGRSFD